MKGVWGRKAPAHPLQGLLGVHLARELPGQKPPQGLPRLHLHPLVPREEGGPGPFRKDLRQEALGLPEAGQQGHQGLGVAGLPVLGSEEEGDAPRVRAHQAHHPLPQVRAVVPAVALDDADDPPFLLSPLVPPVDVEAGGVPVQGPHREGEGLACLFGHLQEKLRHPRLVEGVQHAAHAVVVEEAWGDALSQVTGVARDLAATPWAYPPSSGRRGRGEKRQSPGRS